MPLARATLDTVVVVEGLAMPPFIILALVLQKRRKALIGIGHALSCLTIQLMRVLTLRTSVDTQNLSCACLSCNWVCVCVCARCIFHSHLPFAQVQFNTLPVAVPQGLVWFLGSRKGLLG